MRSRWMVGFVVIAGCAAPKPHSSADLVPRPLSVQASGALGDLTPSTLAPSALAASVHDLERRGHFGAASRLAALHADASRAALEDAKDGANPALRSLASAWDRAAERGGDAWSDLIAARQRDPKVFTEFDAARDAAITALRAGKAPNLPLPVPDAVPGAGHLVRFSLRLEGLAALARNDPNEACEHFERGAQGDALMQLLAAVAIDRAGADAGEVGRARDRVLVAAANDARSRPSRADPALLERALELAPQTALDPAVDAALRASAGHVIGVDSLDDARSAGWIIAGFDRLDRGEPELALKDLRRAEEATGDARARARLREAQARAFLALGEPAAARTILTLLATDPDSSVARPALATLGALELRLERAQLARELLERALEEPELDWPGLSEAHANLALALLSTGDEETGLRVLRHAEARFELEGDFAGLTQALENELLAHVQASRTEEAAAVRARLESMAAR